MEKLMEKMDPERHRKGPKMETQMDTQKPKSRPKYM